MRIQFAFMAASLLALSACGYVDAYEEAVYDYEPVYCYRSVGGVTCYNEPVFQDQRRLVNYFGPHPSRYDAPEPPTLHEGQAPEAITTWYKDPEPVVGPAVVQASVVEETAK